MAKDILLSPKHGLNPSLEICYICGKDKGVILFGKMKDDQEAPRQACLTKEPCSECAHWMTQGVICISVDPDKTTDQEDPWRSGGWIVLKDEAVQQMLGHNQEMLDDVLNRRVMFVEDAVWEQLGFPEHNSTDN